MSMGRSDETGPHLGVFGLIMSWSKCVWVVACATALTGCELWLNVDGPQCTTDQNCRELVGLGYTCGTAGVCVAPIVKPDAGDDKPALPDRWACLGKPPTSFVADPDMTVQVRMDAVDFNTLRVPPGLEAQVCRPADVECAEPIASHVQPGSDGFFAFTLPYGFDGFFIFTAPNIVPSLLYRNRPYIDSVTTSGPALASEATLEDISKLAGRPRDPTTGVAILEVRDCKDAAGDGVQFDSVAGEDPFYFEGSLPGRLLTATTISNSLGANREPRAVGGFSNLTPGYITFQAHLAATQAATQDPVARHTLQIRAGYITYTRIFPGTPQ
jgi:hypothetical protein